MLSDEQAQRIEESALSKAAESADLKRAFFAEQASNVVRCGAAMARKLQAGGRLFTFGNGGSACDAEHIAVEFMHPVVAKRRPLRAMNLSSNPALLTAVGNDVDSSLGYARQLERLANAGDIALGICTSGQSSNVNRALAVGRQAGLLTVGLTGRDGGRMRDECDFVFVVPSYSIHRVQEVHVTLLHVLWDSVHLCLGEEDVL